MQNLRSGGDPGGESGVANPEAQPTGLLEPAQWSVITWMCGQPHDRFMTWTLCPGPCSRAQALSPHVNRLLASLGLRLHTGFPSVPGGGG